MLLYVLGKRDNYNQHSDMPLIPSTCLSVIWQECKDPNSEETELSTIGFVQILRLYLDDM